MEDYTKRKHSISIIPMHLFIKVSTENKEIQLF